MGSAWWLTQQQKLHLCVYWFMRSYFSGHFVTMDTVLLISVTSDHQSWVIRLVISERLCGWVFAHWTWLCNKNNLSIMSVMHEITDGSHVIWHSILCSFSFFCFSLACRALHSCRVWRVVSGPTCPAFAADLYITCSLQHCWTGVRGGISPWLHLYLLFSFASPVGHVCGLIIYEVMETYSYIQSATCAEQMNCESWGYVLNLAYITTCHPGNIT